MTTDPTLARLEAAVRAEPGNWDLRRVYADALEEAGDVVASNGQRWQAKEQRHPRWSNTTATWDWWLSDEPVRDINDVNVTVPSHLSSDVYEALAGHTYGHKIDYWRGWRAIADAEAALARALWALGIRVAGDE